MLCIAWSAIFVRLAGVPGGTSAFYRLAIGGAILVPLWLSRREAMPHARDVAWIAFGGVFFAIDMAAYNSAVLLAGPAAATLIGNTSPLFVGILGIALLRRRQPKRFWGGFALALAGSAAIVGVDGLRAAGALAGDGLAFVSAGAFGVYLLLTERARSRVGTLAFAALSALSSAVALGVYGLACRLPFWGFDARTWSVLLALGVVTQVGGYLSIGKALGKLSAATVSVSLLMQAVVTALLSVVVLHDRLSPAEIAGGAIVLTGVGIVNVPRSSRRPATPESAEGAAAGQTVLPGP